MAQRASDGRCSSARAFAHRHAARCERELLHAPRPSNEAPLACSGAHSRGAGLHAANKLATRALAPPRAPAPARAARARAPVASHHHAPVCAQFTQAGGGARPGPYPSSARRDMRCYGTHSYILISPTQDQRILRITES